MTAEKRVSLALGGAVRGVAHLGVIDVLLESGSLCEAVRASSAIPGVVPPVSLGGRRLVDGAVTCLVPVNVLKPHVNVVIGVDVSDANITVTPRRAYIVAWQAAHISVRQLRSFEMRQADLMICANSPEPVLGFDFTRVDELIELGCGATLAALPRIRALLQTAHPGVGVENSNLVSS